MTKRLAVLLIAVFCMSCSSPKLQEDSLDSLKAFKPDDHYFKAGLKTMHFYRECSSISKVDSFYLFMINQYGLPTDAVNCADGVYVGESPYDAYDYSHRAEITISNEKIVDVIYDEIHKNGLGKRGDAEYNEQMSVAGSSPAKAYPLYEQQLLTKQNILDIDGVTGASYSNYRFRYAVMLALMKARMANTNL